MQAPQLAAVGQVRGVLKVVHAAPLGARLKHASVAVDPVRQRLDFGNGQAARLLAVDVLARFGGQQRSQRVPVVAGGDQHRVDVRPGQQFANISRYMAQSWLP